MSNAAFAFFLFVASLSCAAPSASDAFVVEFWSTRFDINKVPAEHREAVIKRIREIAAGGVQNIGTLAVDRLTAARILFHIGDEPFIHSRMESFRTDGREIVTYDMLLDTRQPLLIPYLVACVALKEFNGRLVGGDVIRVSKSGGGARAILNILATSEVFSERTRTAAKSLALRFPEAQVLAERIEAWCEVDPEIRASG